MSNTIEIEHTTKEMSNETLVDKVHPATTTSIDPIKQFQIRFIGELSENALLVDIPEAPRLLGKVSTGAISTFLRKGIVGQIVGAGGIGKTHWLAQLALSVAYGGKFLNEYIISEPGYVYLGLGENDDADIHRLLRKITKGLFIDQSVEGPSNRLAYNSFAGQSSYFMDRNGNETTFYKDFCNELITKEPTQGWSLIILDPISRFLGPNAETDNAAATQFISLLERIILKLHGKPTILFGHHMNKSGIGSADTNQSSARGSSALTDGVRWQANLEKYTPDGSTDDNSLIKFKVVKTNFTAYQPAQILKKDRSGCLFHDEWDKKESHLNAQGSNVKTLSAKSLSEKNREK